MQFYLEHLLSLIQKELKKQSGLAKLRIYAAGSIFNIGLAAIALAITLLLSAFFIGPSFDPNGLEVVSTTDNAPADGVLKGGNDHN